MKSDSLAAGVIALVNSVFPFLSLVGVLHWTANTTSAAELVVVNAVTLGGLIFARSKAPTTP